MANLRHPGTGIKLLHKVLLQTGSQVPHITQQVKQNYPQLKNMPLPPTKFPFGV
jgi:hypothetical protein